MKKSTIVLTAAALAASLLGLDKPGLSQASTTAQSLASLTAKGYDPTMASNALAANADAAALLANINTIRSKNGLNPLTLDPAIGAATMYEETCETQFGYNGYFGIVNGRTRVSPAQMAADFGSGVTGSSVKEYAYSNLFAPGDTDNWPALFNDWQQADATFANVLNSGAINSVGINLVDTGNTVDGHHIYQWAIITGNNPNVTTGTTAQGPTLNLSGLNSTLATQALAAQPTQDEQNFLAALNDARSAMGKPALAVSQPLEAAAFYNAHETGQDNPTNLAVDFGTRYTSFSVSISATDSQYFYGFDVGRYGDWNDLVNDWIGLDPSGLPAYSDGSYGHCGLSIVDANRKAVSALDGQTYEVYKWTFIMGK